MYNGRVIICDDEVEILRYLSKILTAKGFELEVFSSGTALMSSLESRNLVDSDLLLLDVKMPDIDGIEILQRVKKMKLEIPVVIMTAYASINSAIEAMKLGAYDYVTKPFPKEKIFGILEKVLERKALLKENSALKDELGIASASSSLIFASESFREVHEMAMLVAQSESNVVILGESGTGKELVAKYIHYESARAEKPFVAINCAAVPATLLESELFGHEKGAFTDAKNSKKGLFELADGGTVFLDEIGDMEVGMQAKLLRFLEDRTFRRIGGSKMIPVDVRIISATNKDLLKSIEEKSFRNDLYYRLQVIPIFLPALRERREDILPLATHFIEMFTKEFNKPTKGISSMAEKLLVEYSWPGNIRELKNVIERAIILGNDENLLLENLPLEIVAKGSQVTVPMATFKLPPEGIDIEEVERELIKQSLEMTDWNQSKAAKKLNLGIDAFRYRMKKFGFLK